MNHRGRRRPQTWVSSYRIYSTVPGHVRPQKGRWQRHWCLAGENGEQQLPLSCCCRPWWPGGPRSNSWASGIYKSPQSKGEFVRKTRDALGRVFRLPRESLLQSQSTEQLRSKACHLPGAPPMSGPQGMVIRWWPSSRVPSCPDFQASQGPSPPGSWLQSHSAVKALTLQAAPNLAFLSGSGVPGGSNHPGKPCAGGFRECQDHQEQQLLSLCKCEQRQRWPLEGRGDRCHPIPGKEIGVDLNMQIE